jgi:hypothetical protein
MEFKKREIDRTKTNPMLVQGHFVVAGLIGTTEYL